MGPFYHWPLAIHLMSRNDLPLLLPHLGPSFTVRSPTCYMLTTQTYPYASSALILCSPLSCKRLPLGHLLLKAHMHPETRIWDHLEGNPRTWGTCDFFLVRVVVLWALVRSWCSLGPMDISLHGEKSDSGWSEKRFLKVGPRAVSPCLNLRLRLRPREQ